MARSPAGSTPIPVRSAMHRLGEHITTWRKLRQLTVAQVADRAGVTKKTVVTLEAGDNVASGTDAVTTFGLPLVALDEQIRRAA